MKTLVEFIGAGAHKQAWTIKGKPKWVALIAHPYIYKTEKDALALLKRERADLIKIRKLGFPAVTGRIQRVTRRDDDNPKRWVKTWGMIVPRFERGGIRIEDPGITSKQYEMMEKIIKTQDEKNIWIKDLQFLLSENKVVIADPLNVECFTGTPDMNYWKRKLRARIEILASYKQSRINEEKYQESLRKEQAKAA